MPTCLRWFSEIDIGNETSMLLNPESDHQTDNNKADNILTSSLFCILRENKASDCGLQCLLLVQRVLEYEQVVKTSCSKFRKRMVRSFKCPDI